MDKFVVTGVGPAFDGEYPLDIGSFTMREFQIIKRISGVRGGELSEAFNAGDMDLMVALAVIAVRRSGGNHEAFEKVAWESEVGSIDFVVDEGAADEPDPLTPTLPDEPESKPGPPLDSGEHSRTDGDDSQVTSPQAIGSPV